MIFLVIQFSESISQSAEVNGISLITGKWAVIFFFGVRREGRAEVLKRLLMRAIAVSMEIKLKSS